MVVNVGENELHPLRDFLRHSRDDDEVEEISQNAQDSDDVVRTCRIGLHFRNDAE